VHILLTNDDGIYAPGLAALEQALGRLGKVTVVAPTTEQSGVGHSITFLMPLVVKEVYQGDRRRGWSVEGSPADCVKLGITQLAPAPVDLVVSGMNHGLNAGINVLYSGTVAAAIEGAFFGVTSFAVSLEYDEHAPYDRAAALAVQLIEQVLQHKSPEPRLYNINIPTAALREPRGVKVVPMGTVRYGESFQRRVDPRGRAYYWATDDPPPPPTAEETDLTALQKGYLTITPLSFQLTQFDHLAQMKDWSLHLAGDVSVTGPLPRSSPLTKDLQP